ncbi:uncharacterized protein LOC130625322 [Hydractinia symbiolongicarpus]|uniref:uncharacterized protein LOC130625322 n=1 Tax=Hydractinia symbiolongicarpus TaxID=13093 RepID=UPI00254A0264|nr:uncharacterized protein LOC130625322 [Hydractinia symbiolongicarpus]
MDQIRSDSSSNEDENDDIPDLSTLRPFNFEPEFSLEELNKLGTCSSESDEEEDEVSRIGNNNWCQCGGHCRAMESYSESLCCRDTNEIPDNHFEGKQCITEAETFGMVCLCKPVLTTALSALNNLRGDAMHTDNCSLRFAGYKQYTWWIHNRLGKGVRKIIPSCALWAIRNKYPSGNGIYIPFTESKSDDKRLYENTDSDSE